MYPLTEWGCWCFLVGKRSPGNPPGDTLQQRRRESRAQCIEQHRQLKSEESERGGNRSLQVTAIISQPHTRSWRESAEESRLPSTQRTDFSTRTDFGKVFIASARLTLLKKKMIPKLVLVALLVCSSQGRKSDLFCLTLKRISSAISSCPAFSFWDCHGVNYELTCEWMKEDCETSSVLQFTHVLLLTNAVSLEQRFWSDVVVPVRYMISYHCRQDQVVKLAGIGQTHFA